MMAVFEKKKSSKLNLDDTVPLSCIVETAQKVQDHIEYSLRVQRGAIPENSWLLTKRYSDFAALDGELNISGIDLPLPPKKVFGNFDREFVAERQQGLQEYLNAVLNRHILAVSLPVKRFLDPSNYSVNLNEIALQHVSMVFRSEKKWEVVEPLPDIGWRIRKHYILVKPLDQLKVRQILSWSEFGPDKYVPDKELAAVFKMFASIQHPYVCPIVFATANDTGGLVIRDFQEKGTLRDFICRCKPKGHFIKKYGCVKSYSVLELSMIMAMGRQILETLKFLQDKGLPYGNLHAGNILVEQGRCLLLDIENWLLGLPCYYRDYITQFKKIQTVELTDVYCFGHLLYEMCFGSPLEEAFCDTFPTSCPAQIRSVLESILTTEACKNGLPSIADLLSHPLFSDVVLPTGEKPQLKIPSKLKEAIKAAREQMEQKLREEQKIIHKIKRVSKARDFHMSEDEKRKRRKAKKKEVVVNGGQEQDTGGGPMSPTSPTTETVPSTPTSPGAPPSGPPSSYS